jgi:hypothetical protein
MIRQMTLRCECVDAIGKLAHKRFFSGMDSQMGFQITSLGERLCAAIIWTLEWFFSSLDNFIKNKQKLT